MIFVCGRELWLRASQQFLFFVDNGLKHPTFLLILVSPTIKMIISSVASWKDCGSSSNYPLCVMDLYHSKLRASSLKMEPFTVSYDQRSEFLKLSYLHSFQHSNVKVRHSLNPRTTPTRLHEPHALVISNEHPQNADFPRNYSRKEKKPFPVPIVELRRAARERLKKSKGQPKGRVPPPKKGLIVQSLLPLAYDVFNARITLINNLRKLLKVVPVHACGWCDEIHVGPEGHPFKSCKGKHATLRNGLHQWTNAAIEDVLVPVEAYHLYDRLGKRITHEERFSIPQIPAVMELCIQAGVHIPEYPTKRRRKPIIRIGKREFADADESDLPDLLEVPLKPLLIEISISEAVAPANEVEKTLLAEETLQAWEKMRKGAKRLMQMYRVRACGYCPEVHVGPSGHKAQNCGAHKHQQRNGQHGWQSAVLDDLIPPRYVWHVPDVVGLPLRRELRNFYGQAPAVVEICFQAGAAVPDQYKSTMRLDIGIPSSVKEAEMAI
ncbi:PREDICTED: APO protein 2, chloroplastic-like [Populus euphratica]|uniref:APO protein 2, chloroplastic-like n=1 Tax=Populus euphratica TaxID=75702 RepID=A0AAJ6TW11_POPEU|nr:PREDICTED: APO protein 2, chloroplastic-like [Populus euphratica]